MITTIFHVFFAAESEFDIHFLPSVSKIRYFSSQVVEDLQTEKTKVDKMAEQEFELQQRQSRLSEALEKERKEKRTVEERLSKFELDFADTLERERKEKRAVEERLSRFEMDVERERDEKRAVEQRLSKYEISLKQSEMSLKEANEQLNAEKMRRGASMQELQSRYVCSHIFR